VWDPETQQYSPPVAGTIYHGHTAGCRDPDRRFASLRRLPPAKPKSKENQ
jgi:hypothetical protein